jgi:hypothetical protein
VSRRPPVVVIGLTVGDFLLWNWSLNAGHDVLALISGLTLPPLALLSAWVLALGTMRAIAAGARFARRARTPPAAQPARRSAGAGRAAPHPARGDTAAARERSGKIAA